MSYLLTIGLPIFTTVLGAIITYYLSKKNKQDLLSEDIEEVHNPDGSSIRKEKRKFK